MSAAVPLTQRQVVLDAMRRRGHDPWPRGEGHIVLGLPGTPRLQKAYHEPGGGFSPAAGSLGVSIMLPAGAHGAARTGDELPLAEITQRYVWADDDGVPALETITPHYACVWTQAGDVTWSCAVEQRSAAAGDAATTRLLVRSVGPAGGPLEHLSWDGRQLLVNHRWVLTVEPAPAHVCLGNEEQPGWLDARSEAQAVDAPDGWGYARFDLPGGRATLTIRDTAPFFHSPLTYHGVRSALQLDLPDAAFVDSLNAQAANLLMGYIGRQTCPGEPTNYPLAWERDGAYSVMAMARCGQLDTAQELAVYFGENDYFGGFGAEGDAPGSAINLLVGVGLISGNRAFQEWSWPHIRRKLGLIQEMYSARETLRKNWIGPLVPELRGNDRVGTICRPTRDGLIIGNMDLHYPALYINAMTYRGVQQAWRLAQALGVQNEVEYLPDVAAQLRRGWEANLHVAEFANERTYMTGIWPTWITRPDYEPFVRGLAQRWESDHQDGTYPQRPLWTYFTLAEAHQWLYMGRPDRAWKTLDYFWRHQSSPGLYTYWEGAKEENGFGLWPHVRGWVAPELVTPHYWTAAEMLLLQIDMLAYVSEAGPEPELVLGAGVPLAWLDHSFAAGRLPTPLGVVDWNYRGGTVHATLRGPRSCRVRLGAGFGRDTRIDFRQVSS